MAKTKYRVQFWNYGEKDKMVRDNFTGNAVDQPIEVEARDVVEAAALAAAHLNSFTHQQMKMGHLGIQYIQEVGVRKEVKIIEHADIKLIHGGY